MYSYYWFTRTMFVHIGCILTCLPFSVVFAAFRMPDEAVWAGHNSCLVSDRSFGTQRTSSNWLPITSKLSPNCLLGVSVGLVAVLGFCVGHDEPWSSPSG